MEGQGKRERERERERERDVRERECILKVQVPGVSMRPHCAQTQMTCSAVVLQ